ncbi:MAG: hypothetical protein AAF447_22875 [Myxococcota bacterium]
MDLDVDAAFTSYLRRFSRHYGAKLPGTFVRFGRHMVQKLDREGFEDRMTAYLGWHRECGRVLESGATISDAAVLEFEESAAWLALEVPNLLELFDGELGDLGEELGRVGDASE